jgi:L-asparaginase
LGPISKPVIFTGAQKPFEEKGSDAKNNILHAVETACAGDAGVFIVFGSKKISGVCATKVSESDLNAFESPLIQSVQKKNLNIAYPESFSFEKNVCVIDCLPGISEETAPILPTSCRGVVIRGFGAANIPSKLLSWVKRIRRMHIPVVVVSQCARGVARMKMYKVGTDALSLGVLSGGDMTLEAVVTKLMWILGQTTDEEKISYMFMNSLIGERTI